jgi:conjugal transfer/entry exclusion protein
MSNKELYARDKKSKAILNMDTESLLAYKQARNDYYRIQTINNELQGVKKDVAEIKDLLLSLINGKNNG